MKTSRSRQLLLVTLAAGMLAACGTSSGSPVAAPSSNTVTAVAPAAHPLTIKAIRTLIRAKKGDDAVIAQINETHSVFWLDASDIVKLQYAGLSDKVVAAMIDSTTNLAFSQPPPAPRPEDVVAAPGTDFVWIPGEWICPSDQWVWIEGGWILPPTPNAQWVEPRWQQKPDGWHRVPGRWRPPV